VSKIFKENFFGNGYGMNCIMKAQMVCCGKTEVYADGVSCVSLLPFYGLVFSPLWTNIWDHKHSCSHFRLLHCLRLKQTGHSHVSV